MGRAHVVMTLSNPFNVDPRVYKEARTLVNGGYKVTILAWDREGTHSENEIVDGINVRRIKVRSRYGSIFSFLLSLPRFYLKALLILLKTDFDVIHTHDFDTAPLGAIIKLLKKKKWVYDIHDIYFTRISLLKEKKSNSLIQKILNFMEISLAKSADVVITVTKSLSGEPGGFKEFYAAFGVPLDKIEVIWNTPLKSMFTEYPQLNLKKSKRLTVGYVGSIRTVRNFIPLFEVAKREGYKLLFVGAGKSKSEVEELARDRYPDVDVEFTGNIPYKLIPNYYELCDVLYSYFPPTENVKRTITVKVFESAFLGIPSIVNEDSLMADFVRMFRCGVPVDNPTPKKLKDAIEKAKRLKFSRGPFEKKWVWESQEDKLLRIYRQVMDIE